MKLLIVDDNLEMRRLMRAILTTVSNTIYECDDGAKAFSAYERHKPDWVLMDVEMKEKNGLMATKEICAAFPVARIVIVTKYNHTMMREAATRAGACAYVSKDNLLELRAVLNLQPSLSSIAPVEH